MSTATKPGFKQVVDYVSAAVAVGALAATPAQAKVPESQLLPAPQKALISAEAGLKSIPLEQRYAKPVVWPVRRAESPSSWGMEPRESFEDPLNEGVHYTLWYPSGKAGKNSVIYDDGMTVPEFRYSCAVTVGRGEGKSGIMAAVYVGNSMIVMQVARDSDFSIPYTYGTNTSEVKSGECHQVPVRNGDRQFFVNGVSLSVDEKGGIIADVQRGTLDGKIKVHQPLFLPQQKE